MTIVKLGTTLSLALLFAAALPSIAFGGGCGHAKHSPHGYNQPGDATSVSEIQGHEALKYRINVDFDEDPWFFGGYWSDHQKAYQPEEKIQKQPQEQSMKIEENSQDTISQNNSMMDEKKKPENMISIQSKSESLDELLEPVWFKSGDHQLTPEARESLAMNAEVLKEMSNVNITIEGHADRRGERELNNELGMKRAEEVRQFLQTRGIHPSRMQAVSHGFLKPLDERWNREAHSKNRRVGFVLSQ